MCTSWLSLAVCDTQKGHGSASFQLLYPIFICPSAGLQRMPIHCMFGVWCNVAITVFCTTKGTFMELYLHHAGAHRGLKARFVLLALALAFAVFGGFMPVAAHAAPRQRCF